MAVKEETWSNKRLIDEGKQLSRIKYLIFRIRYGRLSQHMKGISYRAIFTYWENLEKICLSCTGSRARKLQKRKYKREYGKNLKRDVWEVMLLTTPSGKNSGIVEINWLQGS